MEICKLQLLQNLTDEYRSFWKAHWQAERGQNPSVIVSLDDSLIKHRVKKGLNQFNQPEPQTNNFSHTYSGLVETQARSFVGEA